jgi:hypothetical protein
VELPHAVQTLLWGALHVVALIVACLAMPTRASVRFGALITGALMYPVIDDIRLGNVSVLVLCLAAVSWRWLGRPASSVALAVSMAIRPTQGVVLIAWLLRRAWRPAIWTCLAGLGLVVVTLPVVGIDGWFDYLTMLRNLGSGMGVPFDFSIGSVGLRAGLSSDLASLLQLGGYVLGAAAVLVSLRRDPATSFQVAIGASLLLAPLLWVHYLSLTLLPAAFLAHRGRVLPLVLLAPVSWLPTILGQGDPIYPLLAIAATIGPLLAPVGRSVIAGGDAEGVTPGGSRNAPVQEWDPEQVPQHAHPQERMDAHP